MDIHSCEYEFNDGYSNHCISVASTFKVTAGQNFLKDRRMVTVTGQQHLAEGFL